VSLIYLHTKQGNKEAKELTKKPFNFIGWGTFTEQFSGVRGLNFIKLDEDIGQS